MKNTISVPKGFRGLLGALGLCLSAVLLTTTAHAADYALLVGVNEYDPDYIPADNWLQGCVPDAMNMQEYLLSATDFHDWNEESTFLLTNADATKEAIRAAITNLAMFAQAGDTFLYYHSSHGGNYTASGTMGRSTFLCAADANYSDAELAKDLLNFQPGVNILVIVDFDLFTQVDKTLAP